MSNSKPLLGILGGTFDPVHEGHILLARHALQQLNCERVEFIPCRLPVNKAPSQATPQQRLDMLALATAEYSNFSINCCEIERSQPSYMLLTMQQLQIQYPKHHLVLILGMDAFNGFQQWFQWQEILRYCHLAVGQRTSQQTDVLLDSNWYKSSFITSAQRLTEQAAGLVFFMDNPLLDISSTTVRQTALLHHLALHCDVATYIAQHQLYQTISKNQSG